MPTRKLRYRKVKRNNTMYGQHKWCCKRGKQQVRSFISMPVTHASSPTQGNNTVSNLPDFRCCSISHRCKVRNHAQVPKQQRNRKVRANRKNVPKKWASKLRPHIHLVWNWEEPIRKPNTTNVNAGECTSTNNSENRHRFREAVNCRSPLLSKEEENRGNQGASVTDANPENEVYDWISPSNWVVVTPNTNTSKNKVAN